MLEKHVRYDNPNIRLAAHGETCTLCGIANGTTVFAHFNYSWAGKGMGLKADDCAGMFLCFKCHYSYDHQGERHVEKIEDWEVLRAYYRTIRRLLDRGVLV